MSHDKTAAQINDALAALPLVDRVSALCASILHEEPRAPFAICVLVEVATVLTKNLPPSQQAAVAWHLQSAIEEMRVKWN